MKKIITIIAAISITIFLLTSCGSETTNTEQRGNVETDTLHTTEAITTEGTEEVEQPNEEAEQSTEEVEQPTEEAEQRTVESELPIEETKPPVEEATEGAEAVEQVAESEPVEETTATYTYTDMSTTLYVQSAVNVRDLPDTDGNKLGGLSINDEVTVTGQCNETGWYRVVFNGSIAYVSNKFLDESKVKIPQSEQQTNASSQGGGTSVTVPSQEETGGNLVWVPIHGGTKYHSKSSCSGMKNPMQVSVETAIANGYTPCKKCY